MDERTVKIHTERPILAAEGAREYDSYFARPESGRGPGLLIFSEMWGLAPSKTEMADDYARRGWCALAPNQFWRSDFTGVVPYEQADKAWERLSAFDWERAAEDARTAADWLRASPQCNGKLAAIGFCMGGRISFLAAAHAGIDAAVSLYALGIAKHLDALPRIPCPLQLHYGLNDRHIPQSEIDAVTAAAQGNPNVTVYGYPGAGHAFFSDNRPTFDPKAKAEAMARIDALFAKLA